MNAKRVRVLHCERKHGSAIAMRWWVVLPSRVHMTALGNFEWNGRGARLLAIRCCGEIICKRVWRRGATRFGAEHIR